MAQIDIIGAEWFGTPEKDPNKPKDKKPVTPAKSDYSWVAGVSQGVGGLISSFFGPKSSKPKAAAPVPWIPIVTIGGGIMLLTTIILTKKR